MNWFLGLFCEARLELNHITLILINDIMRMNIFNPHDHANVNPGYFESYWISQIKYKIRIMCQSVEMVSQ